MTGKKSDTALQTISVRTPDLIFVACIVGLSVTGLISYEQLSSVYYRNNLLPVSAIFDLMMVVYVFAFPTYLIPKRVLFFLVLSVCYLLISILIMPNSIGGAPSTTDIIVSFKPFIYVIILSLARPSRGSITIKKLEKVYKYLLVAFLIKYFVARILLGIPRPGLFGENNFELVFLTLLYIFLSHQGKLQSNLWVIIILAIVLLSGSRSGLLALSAAIICAPRKRSSRAIMTLAVAVGLFGLLTFADTRFSLSQDITQIDRFIFLQAFVEELRAFSIVNYLVGWSPMTPLSDATCQQLGFYTALFSSGNPNVCYPVILHVFYFRIILDHGLIGLAFLIFGFYQILRSRGVNSYVSAALVLQGLINGLSISGLANTYFAFALFLVIIARDRTFTRAPSTSKKIKIDL